MALKKSRFWHLSAKLFTNSHGKVQSQACLQVSSVLEISPIKKPSRILAFQCDERGVISVESVLWVPIFLVFFTLIADVSLMFHGQTKAMRIVQDANRLASTGVLADADAVEAQVLDRLHAFSANAEVESVFDAETVLTTVRVPAGDLVAIGIISNLVLFDITVSSLHLVEG